MGHRRRAHAVAAARARRSHGAALRLPHGRRLVRDAGKLCEGRRDVRWRSSRADERRAASLQAAHSSGLHDLSDFAIHPHDSYLERRGCARLPVPALSDRSHAADTGEGGNSHMSVSVNGVGITAGQGTTNELSAVRELLRQRAVAIGLLDEASREETTIERAIENLLACEVVTPTPTEEECRRYYEAHPREFESGDLVHARHILFQVTPAVRIPEIRARAEQTLNELLREPERFAAVAAEMSNCPSGQQGGNLGQIGRGDTVPEFERALFRLGPNGLLRELVKTRYGFHIVAVDRRIPGTKLPFDMVRDDIAERLRAMVEEKALRQYISVLAGQADIQGADLNATPIPLVQ